MKNIQTIIIALTCSILLGACSAVRQCKPPELNLPESIISGATDTLTLADIEWWRLYGDSALCDIITTHGDFFFALFIQIGRAHV